MLSEPSTFTLWRLFFFSIFYFLLSFLREHKKHKNAHNRISDFSPLRCFSSAFFIFVGWFAFFCFLCFWCFWCFFCFLCFWCVRNIFVKKKKKFKTALMTSFTVLLKFILLQAWIFWITIFFNYHDLFSIITTFFNYHVLFQLLQSFSIIMAFFQLSRSSLLQSFLSKSFFNLFTTCSTICMKISQRTNTII